MHIGLNKYVLFLPTRKLRKGFTNIYKGKKDKKLGYEHSWLPQSRLLPRMDGLGSICRWILRLWSMGHDLASFVQRRIMILY